MRRRRRATGTHRLVLVDPTAARAERRGRVRRRSLRVVAVAAALAALAVGLPAGAEAVTVPRTLFRAAAVGSAPVVPGFAIDHVGVRFALPPGLDAHDVEGQVAVRMRHDGRWGRWTAVVEDGAQQAGHWTGALVAADGADAYQVRGVPAGARAARAAALNTTDGPRVVVGHRPAGAADAATPCRSRADWGADESLRRGTPSFGVLQVLTVHHTAGDTAAATEDADAVVRAIYSWHTQGNGWDDIGYQAMVAPDGTFYEGRWSGTASRSCITGGGDGSDFAHEGAATTSRVVTGAHTAGHNTGNLGIAVLGTYTDALPSTAARATLVARLAALAGRHGLDPTGTVAYDNGTSRGSFPAIAGHRDLVATACPGGAMYADLPRLRADVGATLAPPPAPGPEPEPTSTLVTVHASGEQAGAGTVTGTHADTAEADGVAQRITEAASGGRADRRHDLLDHVWHLDVPAGAATVEVDAVTTAGESFALTASSDGSTWHHVLGVPAGASGRWTAPLPAGLTGRVRVRVVDTARVNGQVAPDTIAVDHLRVVVDTAAVAAASSTEQLQLVATGRKEQGQHVVDLQWTGATDVVVERDGRVVAAVTGTSFTDRIGSKGSATHTYRVCAVTTCSGGVTVDL